MKWFSLENRVWAASFLNVAAMAFQLLTILMVGSTAGVSRLMLVIFLFVQLTFAQIGWEKKISAQFWGMVLSAVFTIVILGMTFVYP